MASLKMNIPHQLQTQEALTRIKNLLGKLQQEQSGSISNVKESWEGDTGHFQFTAKGYNLAGTIKVEQGQINIDAKVPFAVSLFQGKIKQLINQKTRELLS